jgi:mannose-6-phosphate isomerase-like protein (cupin superfamily)
MRIVQKPWGHEEIWAETATYVGKVLFINPGHRLSRQYHNLKEETFRVIKGQLHLEIGSGDDIKTQILRVGECFHCPPGTIHRMICHPSFNDSAVEVLEVSTNHLDDVVRLEDDYKR